MLGHIVSRAATELSYTKRSFYMKSINTEKNWTFELGVGDGVDLPFYVKVGYMQRDRINQQDQNNDTLYTPSVVNAHRIDGSGKNPDAGTICNYATDKYSHAYGETVSCFRHLAKNSVSQPKITRRDFMTHNIYPDGNPGYNIYVFANKYD